MTHGYSIRISKTTELYGIGIFFGRDIIVDKSSRAFKILARYNAFPDHTPVHYHNAFRRLRGHFAHRRKVGIEFLSCAAAARKKFQIGMDRTRHANTPCPLSI